MISAQNHRLLLSGSKWIILAAVIFSAACSPKTQPVSSGAGKKPVEKAPAEKQAEEQQKAAGKKDKPVSSQLKVNTISLILPFGLDHLAPGQQYSTAGLQKAALAVDYYRGFKLALDSLAADGYNYKLQLFDSKDMPAQSRGLALNPQVKNSALIVGPVFPEGLKSFISVPGGSKVPVLSPLSPAAPQTYQFNGLLTAIPPLEYHATRAAAFVKSHIRTKKVYVLMSGYSDEKAYISMFKKAMDSLSKKKITVVAITPSKGNLAIILKQLSKFDRNYFVIPSTRQTFLKTTLYSLDTLSNHYPLTLVGHPSWEKLSYLKAEQMQKLHAHITSGDRVNYKANATVTFVQSYRKMYHAEPSEYSIKAFDEGMFFGRLLAEEKLNDISDEDYKGIHNSFEFVKKPGQGWINNHVMVLRYEDFELKEVE